MEGENIIGAKKVQIENIADAMTLIKIGEKHRKYRQTELNERSSRSHVIFRVFVI
jgi:hypothetical protein